MLKIKSYHKPEKGIEILSEKKEYVTYGSCYAHRRHEKPPPVSQSFYIDMAKTIKKAKRREIEAEIASWQICNGF